VKEVDPGTDTAREQDGLGEKCLVRVATTRDDQYGGQLVHFQCPFRDVPLTAPHAGVIAPNVEFAPMRIGVRKIPTDIRLQGAA
jgi:hypothetical protein